MRTGYFDDIVAPDNPPSTGFFDDIIAPNKPQTLAQKNAATYSSPQAPTPETPAQYQARTGNVAAVQPKRFDPGGLGKYAATQRAVSRPVQNQAQNGAPEQRMKPNAQGQAVPITAADAGNQFEFLNKPIQEVTKFVNPHLAALAMTGPKGKAFADAANNTVAGFANVPGQVMDILEKPQDVARGIKKAAQKALPKGVPGSIPSENAEDYYTSLLGTLGLAAGIGHGILGKVKGVVGKAGDAIGAAVDKSTKPLEGSGYESTAPTVEQFQALADHHNVPVVVTGIDARGKPIVRVKPTADAPPHTGFYDDIVNEPHTPPEAGTTPHEVQPAGSEVAPKVVPSPVEVRNIVKKTGVHDERLDPFSDHFDEHLAQTLYRTVVNPDEEFSAHGINDHQLDDLKAAILEKQNEIRPPEEDSTRDNEHIAALQDEANRKGGSGYYQVNEPKYNPRAKSIDAATMTGYTRSRLPDPWVKIHDFPEDLQRDLLERAEKTADPSKLTVSGKDWQEYLDSKRFAKRSAKPRGRTEYDRIFKESGGSVDRIEGAIDPNTEIPRRIIKEHYNDLVEKVKERSVNEAQNHPNNLGLTDEEFNHVLDHYSKRLSEADHGGDHSQVEATGQNADVQPGVSGSASAEQAKPNPQEVAPVEGAKESTGIANQVLDREAAAGDIQPVEKGHYRSLEEIQQAGKKAVEGGVNPETHLTMVESRDGAATSHDMAIFLEGRRLKKQAISATREAIRNSSTDAERALHQEKLDAQRADLNHWDSRTQRLRTEGGEAFYSNQMGADVHTGDFEDVIQAARDESPNGKLSPAREAWYQKQIDDLKKAHDDLASKQFNQTRAQVRRAKIADVDAEWDDLLKQASKHSVLNAGLSPELAKIAAKAVVNRIKKGALTLEEAVENVVAGLRAQGVTVEHRDVRDAFSGYGTAKDGAPETSVKQLKREAVLLSKIEDLNEGVEQPKGKSGKVETPREKALREEMNALKAKIKAEGPGLTDAERLDRYKKSLQGQIKSKQNQLDTGNFKTKLPKDSQVEALKSRIAMLDAQIRNAIASERKTSFGEHLAGGVRMNVLSGPSTLSNLGTAVGGQAFVTPFDELVGPLIKHTVGRIGGLAEKSGPELNFSLKAELKAIGQSSFPHLYKVLTKQEPFATSAWAKVLGKGGDIQNKAIAMGLEPPHAVTRNPILRFEQNIHDAIKTPAERNGFAREYEKTLAQAKRAGLDPNDANVQQEAWAQAYLKSKEAKLQNDSAAHAIVKTVLDAPKSATGKGLMRTVAPITKIPINFAGRAAEYGGGLPGAILRHIYEATREGGMSPEIARKVAQQYKRGLVGSSLFLIAANSDLFDVDDHDRLVVGGHTLPHSASHLPFIEPLAMGVYYRKSQSAIGGLFESAAKGARGVVNNTPFVSAPRDIVDMMGQWYQNNDSWGQKAGQTAAKIAAGKVVPQALSQTAKNTDLQHDPQSWVQWVTDLLGGAEDKQKRETKDENKMQGAANEFKALLPGMRQQLPAKY